MIRFIANMDIKRKLIFLFLIAFFFRFIYFLFITWKNYPEGFLMYDSYGYLQLAANLVDNGNFSQSFISPLEADYFRTPLYPLFLAVFKLLDAPVWLAVFIQLVLSSLTVVFIFRICGVLKLNEHASVLSALLFCIEPSSVCFSMFVLTESLFVLLFTWSIYFLLRYIKERVPSQFYFFSLLLGLATLMRPAPVYLSMIIFPLFFVIRPVERKATIIGILVFILTLSPWLIRNQMTFGKPFLTKLDDEMLLFYHASSVLAEKEQISLAEAQNKLWTSALADFKGDAKNDIVSFAPFVRDRAIEVIRSNSGIYARQHFYGMLSIAFKPVRGYFDAQAGLVKGYQSITPGEFPANQKIRKAFFTVSSGFSVVMVIIQILILAFCYLFFYHGFRFIRIDSLYAALILIILFLYFFNLVVPPYSEGRLRLPLIPFILIIGAAGFYEWRRSRSLKS